MGINFRDFCAFPIIAFIQIRTKFALASIARSSVLKCADRGLPCAASLFAVLALVFRSNDGEWIVGEYFQAAHAYPV